MVYGCVTKVSQTQWFKNNIYYYQPFFFFWCLLSLGLADKFWLVVPHEIVVKKLLWTANHLEACLVVDDSFPLQLTHMADGRGPVILTLSGLLLTTCSYPCLHECPYNMATGSPRMSVPGEQDGSLNIFDGPAS